MEQRTQRNRFFEWIQMLLREELYWSANRKQKTHAHSCWSFYQQLNPQKQQTTKEEERKSKSASDTTQQMEEIIILNSNNTKQKPWFHHLFIVRLECIIIISNRIVLASMVTAAKWEYSTKSWASIALGEDKPTATTVFLAMLVMTTAMETIRAM